MLANALPERLAAVAQSTMKLPSVHTTKFKGKRSASEDIKGPSPKQPDGE